MKTTTRWAIQAMVACVLLISMLPSVASAQGGRGAKEIQGVGEAVERTVEQAPADASTPQGVTAETWDERFGVPGIEGQVYTVVADGNGNVYAAGSFTKAGGIGANNIAMFDGRSWHPLGNGLNDRVRQIVLKGNELYAVGSFTAAGEVDANYVARWDGAAWSAVGTGEGPLNDFGAQGWLNAVAVIGNRVYIGGDFITVDGVAANNIAQWNGTTWSPLGRGVGELDWEGKFSAQGEVKALAVDGTTLYVGGAFVLAGQVTANSIATWNTNTGWAAVGTGLEYKEAGSNPVTGIVTALAIANGTVYAGGQFTKAGGNAANHVAMWNGAVWSALGSGVRAEQFASEPPVAALAVMNGVLYVGGRFVSAGGKAIDLIARWQNNTWSETGGGIQDDGFDEVDSLFAAPTGLVYAGGSYRLIDGKRADNIAVWNEQEWTTLGQGLMRIEFGDLPATPYAMAGDDAGHVFVGGEFLRAGGVAVSNLAAWDGDRWHDIGGANARVRAMVYGDGNLYIAGEFTQAGGIAANHVAVWNAATGQWSALGAGINGDVYALTYSNGVLYAGGAFSAAGATAAYDVAYWDGGAWHAFGTKARVFEVGDQGGEVGTYVNALAVSGDRVFVAGHFQTVQFGTNTADLSSFMVVHNVVEWNQETDDWAYLGDLAHRGVSEDGFSGFGIDAYALAVVGDDLYVGGSFNRSGEITAANLARWNITTQQWLTVAGGLGGFDDTPVYALAASGQYLFVGGHFTTAGNTPANFVARLDTLAGTWSPLGGGVKWYNDQFTEVRSLAVTASGVYVGGAFDKAGGYSAPGFARWQGTLGTPNVPAAQGGVVNGDNGAKLTIPAGALPEDSVVTLTTAAQPTRALPEGYAALFAVRPAGTTMTGKQVTQLAQPFTLQMPYTDAQLAAAGITDPSKLNLAYWDGAQWVTLLPCAGCGVDTANHLITATAAQFQEFVVFGETQVVGEQGQKLYLPTVVK